MQNDAYQPVTLDRAIQIMAEPLGLDACEDKEEIRKFVNKYRNLLYNSYRKFKIFDSIFGCFMPQKLPLQCNDPCDKCRQFYWGFTLTKEMGGVVAAFQNGESLPLRSRWRENHTGIINQDYAETQLVEITGRYPTERHLQKASALKIFTYEEKDHGKQVNIEAIDCDGNPITLQFLLEYNSFACSDVKVKEIRGVSLPSLYGHISLFQEDGYELSAYNRHDDKVPNYKRVKVIKGCENSRILVQATRLFRDLHFDDEIVEVGDCLILEEAARYFRYRHSKDQEEVQLAQLARSEMYAFLDGIIARDRGRHLQDNPKYGGIDAAHSYFPSSLY